MVQHEFAIELLKEFRKRNVSTAIETTACVKPDIFRNVAGYLDILYIDMKHWDADKHQEGTGVLPDVILENTAWAIASKKNVQIRIPVIPDYNDSLDDARHFAMLLKQVGADTVQLLPFHQMGERKYELLDQTYQHRQVKAYYPEDLKEYKNTFAEHGIHAFF